MLTTLRRLVLLAVLCGVGYALCGARRRPTRTPAAPPEWPPLAPPSAADSTATIPPADVTALAGDTPSAGPGTSTHADTHDTDTHDTDTHDTDIAAAADDGLGSFTAVGDAAASSAAVASAAVASAADTSAAEPGDTDTDITVADTGDGHTGDAEPGDTDTAAAVTGATDTDDAAPPAGWIAPVDGGCPDQFPIKANDNSRIFHVPGGRFYERTRAERCYACAEHAEADGYRRSKS